MDFESTVQGLYGLRYLDDVSECRVRYMHSDICTAFKRIRMPRGPSHILHAFCIYQSLKATRSPTYEEVRDAICACGVYVSARAFRAGMKRMAERVSKIQQLSYIMEDGYGKSNLEMYIINAGGTWKHVQTGRAWAVEKGLDINVETDVQKVAAFMMKAIGKENSE